MPPSLPRPVLSGLEAALTSCRLTPTPPRHLSRSLSTTPSHLQQFFPPDSPKFITIPEPAQSADSKPSPVKGHLPTPRNIFPTRGGRLKARAAFVKSATPLSKSERLGLPPKSAEEAAHRKSAAVRRKNLAEGIQGLYVRKRLHQTQILSRSQYKVEFNNARANAPERADEVLTRSTVKDSTAKQVQVKPDPHRFNHAIMAKKKTERLAAQKSEARKDALAQLYVAAQTFIVTEKQLEDRVEELFSEDAFTNRGIKESNMWDSQGAPVSIAQRQAQVSGAKFGLSSEAGPALQAAVRQKLVAEELSGGKLVIDTQ
ncbi:hypothetical protein QBC40DRAFT_286362 [Triangularia verruculosa]|uniref:Uncharacterized protein n=1 Tax=Triangularia verruculosa TaxID=2587418 RepID=A0AAN6XBC9_9PEZI|nr:hypothetical protein QBC40DRAFT_286362 [Triangularia verruculosa]